MEIEFLIKTGYYVGICPFRFYRNGGKLGIKAPGTRKVFYCFLHISGGLLAILINIYPNMKMLGKKGDPRFLFYMGVLLTGQFHVASLIHKMWWGRERLRVAVEELGKIDDLRSKRGSRFTKLLLIIVIVLALGFWMYPGPNELAGITSELWGCPLPRPPYSSVPLMGWIKTFSGWGDDCIQPIIIAVRVSTAINFLFYFYFYFAWGLGWAMLVASSFSMYRIAANLINRKSSNTESSDSLVRQYKLAKYRMGILNKALSISPLFAIILFVMYVSIVLPWALMKFEIVSVMDLMMTVIILSSFLVAAESNRMMGEVENFIISSFPMDASNTALTLASNPGDCGLKGWNFFTISYSFVGSVGSAIFTYVLVVMQYQE